MELSILEIFLYILVGFGAAFVQRVSGFGLGIFAMLFLPYLFGNTVTAASISCLWSCFTSVYNATKYRRDVNFRLILPLICAALVTTPIAVKLSSLLPTEIMTIFLGAILIVLSLYFLFFQKKIKIKPTTLSGVGAGALGGALNGLFSTGGPPVVLYLANATDNKATYFASIQLYFAIVNIYATAMRAINGIVTLNIVAFSVLGVVGCVIGDIVGLLIFKRLNSEKIKQIIYIGMIISGLLMLV